MNAPKIAKDFEKTAEWLTITITGKLKCRKTDVRFVASVLADQYNNGWDASVKELSQYRKNNNGL